MTHMAGQHYVVRLTADDGYTAQRSYSVSSAPSDPLVELFVERLETTAGAFRERMDRLGESDPVSQDILIGIVAGIEKQLWMVRTQLA